MIRCEKCERWVHNGNALVCSVCGNPRESVRIDKTSQFCEQCGKQSRLESKFCFNCGFRFKSPFESEPLRWPKESISEHDSTTKRKSSNDFWSQIKRSNAEKLKVFGLISAIFLLIGFFAFQTGGRGESSIGDYSYINTSESSDPVDIDILTRLNEEGSFIWRASESTPITETSAESVYFGGDCAVWTFPNYQDADRANNDGYFSFYKGETWWGIDSLTNKGVTLLTESKDSTCARVVFSVLNWSLDEGSEDSESQNSENTEKTEAYWTGYEGNIGISMALLAWFNSRSEYCESLLPLHPDFDSLEMQDYVRGCLDILKESFGPE